MAQSRAADVFLNVPYDQSVADLFLAYVAGLTTLGLFPRASIEVPGGERRLDRTLKLIDSCQYSVHDLSPVPNSSKERRPPRLNMAFELGLTIAFDWTNPGKHTWFLFGNRRTELNRSLSDLAGTDAYFHGGREAGIFRELGNAFVRNQSQPTVQDMRKVFGGLRQALPMLKHRAGSRNLFTAHVFSDLRVLARALAARMH